MAHVNVNSCRAGLERPDQAFGIADRLALDEIVQIAAPRAGDSLDIDSETFVVQGEPVRDAERLIWTLEACPA